MTAEADAVDAGPAAKKKPRVPLVMIAGGLGAVLVIGAGLYFFVFSGSSDPAAVDPHAASVETPSFIFNLPTMTVNLKSDDGAAAFMKLTIALEVTDQTVMTAIQPKMAKVVDAFQIYLRELRKSDLDGSAGIYRLREELTRRVNIAIAPERVESILFKEILVQ